jgi:putative thioredoxin
MTESPHVVTVSADNFQSVVLEGSSERPVLVDFWADWCAPCRMLMPVLAKLADDYAGKLLVAKVDTEEEQALAAEFGIRSLPTVQLFRGGRPVDQFMGALPESEIRAFLDRHLPRESDSLLAQVRTLLDAGDLAAASGLIDQALIADPQDPHVRVLEAGIKAAAGDTVGAQEIVDGLPRGLDDDPELAALRGRLRFAGIVADAAPEPQLASRLEADPADSEARHQLAAYGVARGDYEYALGQLLELLKRDRAYGDDAGRKGMLMVFELLGGEGDLVSRYRTRMLNALY